MGQLFEKTMDELREAFVRARFAEPNMFGRADILEWIERYRLYGKTSEPSGWDGPALARWVAKHEDIAEFSDARVAVLKKCATPVTQVPGVLFDGVSHFTSRMLIGTMRRSVVLYAGVGPQLLVLSDRDRTLTVAQGKTHDDVIVRPTTADDVLWILFEEFRTGKPKKKEALAWTKELYARAIRSAREDAERDFDEAVAVSADGTEIVKADEVVVVSDDLHRATFYPASTFTGNKILHNKRMTRCDSENTDDQASRFFLSWFQHLRARRLGVGQVFDSVGRRLVTNTSYCPSPLPEGGREIQV